MTFNQGDIIKLNFDPTLGHEQAGYRPTVVISRRIFQEKTGQAIVCPITSKAHPYPTRIVIGEDLRTQGYIICDHIKTIDVNARKPVFIEHIGESTLDKVLAIVYAEIERE
jgi:mRNA interferase MazF